MGGAVRRRERTVQAYEVAFTSGPVTFFLVFWTKACLLTEVIYKFIHGGSVVVITREMLHF
jgi:hypothetical protein